jgi:hypothetical protein
MPGNEVETRWYTFENPKGLKGQAGQARFGRKGAPATGVAAGKSFVLADIEGNGLPPMAPASERMKDLP